MVRYKHLCRDNRMPYRHRSVLLDVTYSRNPLRSGFPVIQKPILRIHSCATIYRLQAFIRPISK